jgi:hypothetical protein
MLTPSQARLLLTKVLLKKQDPELHNNHWVKEQLKTQEAYLRDVIAGTYTASTWPNPPLFH